MDAFTSTNPFVNIIYMLLQYRLANIIIYGLIYATLENNNVQYGGNADDSAQVGIVATTTTLAAALDTSHSFSLSASTALNICS